MFDLWYNLPTALRAGLGVVLLLVAVLIFVASGGTFFAIGLGVVGLVFILFCGAGNDKSGYNF